MSHYPPSDNFHTPPGPYIQVKTSLFPFQPWASPSPLPISVRGLLLLPSVETVTVGPLQLFIPQMRRRGSCSLSLQLQPQPLWGAHWTHASLWTPTLWYGSSELGLHCRCSLERASQGMAAVTLSRPCSCWCSPRADSLHCVQGTLLAHV